MRYRIHHLALVVAVFSPVPSVGQPAPTTASRTESLTGSRVPIYFCFAAYFRQTDLAPGLGEELKLDDSELSAALAARDSLLESRVTRHKEMEVAMAPHEHLRQAEESESTPWGAAYSAAQKTALQAQVVDARKIYRSLILALDTESTDALERKLRNCEGVALASSGPIEQEILEIASAFEIDAQL